MRRRFIPIPLVVLIFALTVSVSSFAYTYVVRPGDTLSGIVKIHLRGRVYGKKGNLARVLRLNPEIKNPNFIYPDREILIDGENRTLSAVQEVRPKSAITAPVPEEKKSGATLELTPSYSMTTLFLKDTATGREATIASQYRLALSANYYQALSETFRVFFHLKLDQVAFEAPSDSTKTLAGRNQFLSELGIGGEFALSSKFTAEVLLKYGKELFGHVLSTTAMEIQAVNIPSISLRGSYDLIQYRRSILGVSALTEIKMPASSDSYSIRLGALFGGTIYLRQHSKEKKTKYQLELEALNRIQNTSSMNQTEMDLVLRLRLPFEIK